MATMSTNLDGKRVAILVADGFEQVEMTEPRKALDAAAAKTTLISPNTQQDGKVRGWQKTEWGDSFPVDLKIDSAKADDFDALLLPGGVLNPDKLRMDEKAVAFVKAFVTAGKPIAAICHGPLTLIEADALTGRKMTSFPSIKTDLKNAGAKWVDEEAVTDGPLVTSRKPDDIPAFNRAMIALFAKGAAPRETAQDVATPTRSEDDCAPNATR